MREPARKYTDLIVWQKAMAAAKVIYKVTEAFPRAEMYGLTAQIRRCAVSIPSNIAEGFGRRGAGEFGQFLTVARGSIFELETQMLLAKEVGFLRDGDYEKVSAAVDEVERMLDALLRRVRESRRLISFELRSVAGCLLPVVAYSATLLLCYFRS